MAKVLWKEYQERTALIFRSFGFAAKTDQLVEGARGKHKVDVLVTPEVRGFKLKWVVECKLWKTNIPKEKVLALIEIVNDIGADRGFLLSEKGFQSGAIRSSQNTNIVLSNASDLELVSKAALKEESLGKIYYRRKNLSDRLWLLHKQSDVEYSNFLLHVLDLDYMDHGIKDAQNGKYPAKYTTYEKYQPADDWIDLISKINHFLDELENLAKKHEQK